MADLDGKTENKPKRVTVITSPRTEALGDTDVTEGFSDPEHPLSLNPVQA
jgi:hypothetical protein